MAKEEKKTHRVHRGGLYLRVDGKLQEIPVGTLYGGEMAEKLEASGWAEPLGAGVSAGDGKGSDKAADIVKAAEAKAAEIIKAAEAKAAEIVEAAEEKATRPQGD